MRIYKQIIVGLIISSVYSSCRGVIGGGGPPQPILGVVRLGMDQYNCEDGSPGTLVFDGKGSLKHSVTSGNPVQFSVMTTYMPKTFNAPEIITQNNTNALANLHKITNITNTSSELNFVVPNVNAYNIKAYYIEYGYSQPSYQESGNTSNCSNPRGVACYRWFKSMDLPSGAIPTANSTTIVINQQDPNGFEGNCK